MKLVKTLDGNVYEAANHFGFWGIKKLSNQEGTKNLTVSISEFLPNGGAEMTSSTKERVYYVLRGTMTIHDERGNSYEMEEGDMIHIGPGEKRSMEVTGVEACSILVIIGEC